MNWAEMVIGIVLIATIGSVLKARYGITKDQHGNEVRIDRGTEAENARLLEEIRALKDRVQVLERVITDNEGSLRLDREIERLRDKNSL